MTRLFKITAAAALALTTAMPAFAAAHLDHSTMTCEEYNGLSAADQSTVAAMAVAEISDVTGGTIADDNGHAQAMMEEQIALLNRTCDRNWDTMVSEAAAGLSGTR